MIMALLDALALVWIMAREQEDPEDGGELWPLPGAEEGRSAPVQRSENRRNSESPNGFPGTARREKERIATAACALPRNDRIQRGGGGRHAGQLQKYLL